MKNKLTPLKSIRKYCLWCVCGNSVEVRLCPSDGIKSSLCPLWCFRFGKRKIGVSVLRAIKMRCRDCGENSVAQVRKCDFTDCQLYPYKMGKNPARRGIGRKGGGFKKKPLVS